MKKKKNKPVYRVYVTHRDDGQYYIGFSSKPDGEYENYYGSSKAISEYTGTLSKETIGVYEKKSHAKMAEFQLQWLYRTDPECLNDMINIRLRLSHLTDYIAPQWKPKKSPHSVGKGVAR